MDYRYMPADERAWLLKMVGVEGEINKIWNEANEGVTGDTEVWVAEFEYELWNDE